MDRKAQAGLEYLVTYGWALIIIATVVGALVFVIGVPETGKGLWISSNPKILFKSSADASSGTDNLELVLQNISGGPITVTQIDLSEGLATGGNAKLNGELFISGTAVSIDIGPGQTLFFEGLDSLEGADSVSIELTYQDYATLEKKAILVRSNGKDSGTGFTSLVVKEDAEESGTINWHIYDNTPEGATISNVLDSDSGNRAIEFNGAGTSNGYRFNGWNDTEHFTIQWKMKYSEGYVVYISVYTTDPVSSHRYIYYTSSSSDGLGTGEYVHHGLGSDTTDGQWHIITRNLQNDLHDAQPDVDLVRVDGFLIRGSGRVDDIILLG